MLITNILSNRKSSLPQMVPPLEVGENPVTTGAGHCSPITMKGTDCLHSSEMEQIEPG